MRGRVRVLYLEPTALVSGGGIALLRLIRALDRSRFAPIVVLGSNGPLLTDFRRVRGCRVLVRSFPLEVAKVTRKDVFVGALKNAGALARYSATLVAVVNRLRPAILHSNGLKMHLFSISMAWRNRSLLIWHIRDFISPPYMPWRTAILLRALARLVPDVLICNSDATRSTIARSKKAVVVSGGIADIAPRVYRVHDGLAHTTETRGATKRGVRRVAMVGRIAPWKGQQVFVTAAARLAEKFDDVRFIIAGSATTANDVLFVQDLKRRIKAMNHGSRIVMAGLVRDVPKFLSNIDVLVHCSLSPEPFGQVIVEGMAAGVPVVASREGGPEEIISDGRTGCLYRPGDVGELEAIIERLLEDPAERQRIGKAAQDEVASRFTIERTAQSVEAVYQKLLTSGARRERA